MSEKEIFLLEQSLDKVKKILEYLELSNKTLDDLNKEEFEKLFEDFVTKKLIEFNNNYMINIMPEFHKKSLEDCQDNIEILEKTWGIAFAYYDLFVENYINLSDNLEDLFIKYGVDIQDDNPTLTSLRFLNGRAIHIANGILFSLRGGYPDDGYSRVRTLYEILIIVNIIVKYGDKLAKRYINYTGSGYGWAKPDIKASNRNNKGKLHFSDLEKNCDLNSEFMASWKKEHKNMHKTVHASPQGTFNRIGGDMYKFISIGPTPYGIDYVANNTLRLMNMIFISYLTCIDDPNNLLIYTLKESYIQLLSDISKKMELEFERLKNINFDENDDNLK